MGLGPGGTPSGDDFLVGSLAARWWLADDPRACPLAASLADRAPSRTTRLAAEFYYHLARGRLSDQLGRLLSALATGEVPEIEQAAEALAGYGATSGRDTIAGVHAALLPLAPRP
jgi:hypothetical protein